MITSVRQCNNTNVLYDTSVSKYFHQAYSHVTIYYSLRTSNAVIQCTI